MHVCILCGQPCGCSAVELALHPNDNGCAHRCNSTDDDLPSLSSLFGLFKDAPLTIEHIESGWDDVADIDRELRIIRGEPIEWAEHAIAMFEDLRAYHETGGNAGAAGVAQLAINKFRELL